MVLASSLGLLSSREFVRDLAWFAEQLVMTDMTPQFFDDADKLCAACRERPAFFAPDKVGADASEAAVAATRRHPPCPCLLYTSPSPRDRG